jgi:hypothetical protein
MTYDLIIKMDMNSCLYIDNIYPINFLCGNINVIDIGSVHVKFYSTISV